MVYFTEFSSLCQTRICIFGSEVLYFIKNFGRDLPYEFQICNGERLRENNVLYKMEVSKDESVLFIEENSKIDITYADTDVNDKIKQIVSWKFSEVTQ